LGGTREAVPTALLLDRRDLGSAALPWARGDPGYAVPHSGAAMWAAAGCLTRQRQETTVGAAQPSGRTTPVEALMDYPLVVGASQPPSSSALSRDGLRPPVGGTTPRKLHLVLEATCRFL